MDIVEYANELKKLCDANSLISLNNAILLYNDSIKKMEAYKDFPTLYDAAKKSMEHQLQSTISFIASVNKDVKNYIDKQTTKAK